jgi:HEAT repeat protein
VAAEQHKTDEVEKLISTLRTGKSQSARRKATQALGESGDERALEPLVAAL